MKNEWLKRKEALEKFFGIHKYSVFVLDDNRMYLKGISHHIETRLGDKVKVKAFLTSDELLRQIVEEPNAVIIDYHLDEKSSVEGIALVQMITNKSPKTEVIVLTNEQSADIALRCYDEGASNYIKKSFDAVERVIKELMYKIDIA